ncbi:MAG: hydantoinase/oxoprolinase family protein, partial [Gammaproteobacteria bacterium]
FGLVAARPLQDRALTVVVGGREASARRLTPRFRPLVEAARAALRADGVPPGRIVIERWVDCRYRGQSFALTVDWEGGEAAAAAFEALHEARYGHRLPLPVELVTLRLQARGPRPALELAGALEARLAGLPAQTRVHGLARPVPVRRRAEVPEEEALPGPALVVDPVATTWLAPGWRARRHPSGSLLLEKG